MALAGTVGSVTTMGFGIGGGFAGSSSLVVTLGYGIAAVTVSPVGGRVVRVQLMRPGPRALRVRRPGAARARVLS